MPASAAIGRRRGGAQQRRIPWEYVGFVLVTVFFFFFFLYVRALDDVVHRGKRQHTLLLHQPPSEKRETLQRDDNSETPKDLLILSTELGDIRIQLREDWSKPSVDYLRQIIAAGECPRCSFYRAEERGILQGIVKNPNINLEQITKGDCPPDLQDSKWKENCHGPIMEHGMVGWAGGKTGPDFFIDWYKKPAKFWGAQHTVWGQVILEDSQSTNVMEKIWELPAKKNGLVYLVEPLKFQMKIVAE